jgi:hypothetical protein
MDGPPVNIEEDRKPSMVVYSWWWWVLAGGALGVLIRFAFGALFQGGLMSLAFLVGTPFTVGALTAYGARHRERSFTFLFLAPWITVALMMAGCAVTLLEGAICIAIMSPLFLVCASLGSFAMAAALRLTRRRQSHLTAVAVLPFLMILAEGSSPLSERTFEIRDAVIVDATPTTVWNQILDARSIRPEELRASLVHFIGVPRPVEGVNLATAAGEVRFSKWERGVNFRARVLYKKPGETITWRYLFDQDSFPPGSMDDHVAVGGRYFDVGETTFNLEALPGGRTRLEIVAHYRVSSSINFYAVPVARLLGRDFVAMILDLYKTRSERWEHRSSL